MIVPSVLSHAEFLVDPVLAPREPEQLGNEDDQAALGGHVKTKRKAEDMDLVQARRKEVDEEAREEPDAEHQPHQTGGLLPIGLSGPRIDIRRRLVRRVRLRLGFGAQELGNRLAPSAAVCRLLPALCLGRVALRQRSFPVRVRL